MEELDNKILRQVSSYEYMLIKFGNVTTRNKISGKITKNEFYKALQIITNRHPLLMAVLFDYENKVYFKKVDNFTLPIEVKEYINNIDTRDSLYIKELNDMLNPYQQLWRIFIIYDSDENNLNDKSSIEMILTIHHIICDAISHLNLVKEILEQIEAIQNNKHLYEDRKLPLIDSCASFLHNHAVIKKNYIMDIYDDITPDQINVDLTIPSEQCTLNYLKGRFTELETDLIVNKCKNQGITVHAILSASILMSMANEIDPFLSKEFQFIMQHPVDLRRRYFFLPDKENLICSVSIIRTLIPFNNFDIISFAKQILYIFRNRYNQSDGLEYFLSALSANDFKQTLKRRGSDSVAISNVGKIDIPVDYYFYKLMDIDFTASFKNLKNILCSVVTFDHCLGYILLYPESRIKKELVERINTNFTKILLEFIRM